MTNYFKKYLFKLTFVFVIALCTTLGISNNAHAEEIGKWTKKADMPKSLIHHSSVVLDSKIYVLGGLEGDELNHLQLTSSVYSYDANTNIWIKKADMPQPLNQHSAVSFNGKIYVFGGQIDSKLVSSVYEYDPNTDIWTKKADMPQSLKASSVAVFNDKIYVMGGSDGNHYVSTVISYDPVKNTWSKKSNLPTATGYAPALVFNDKIYIIGGDDPSLKSASIQIYDPIKDGWTQKSNIWSEALYYHSATVLNNKIYVLGDGRYSTIVNEYDPTTNTLTKKFDMPLGKIKHTSVTLNNKIYNLGGTNGKSYLPLVEEYDPNPNIIMPTLSVNKTTLDLAVGQTDKLTATITPESTPKQKIIWSSSDPSIASISVDGDCYVTGEKEGTAVITAKTEDGKLIATCTVNVRGEGEVLPSKNRALLRVALTNGSINEYDLSMTEVQNFINWYNGRAEGKGNISFAINKNANVKPFKTRTDYLVFDKIYSFEVNEYELNNNER